MAPNRRAIRITAYWGFIVIGIGNIILGPALLSILDTFHISPSGAGPLFFASSLGYLLAVLIGGPAGDHWGRRLALQSGAGLYVLGLVAFAIAPAWFTAVLAMFLIGIGGGVIDSGTNAMANDIASPEGHAAEQSFLHAFFGLGALLGPLVIGAFLAIHAGWRPAYMLIAAGALVLLAMFSRLEVPARVRADAPISVRSVANLATNPMVLVMALMLGVYVGAEILVGDWAATFLQRIHHMDSVAAATSVGLYWGGIAAGRLLSGLAARWFTGRTLLIGTCALSLVGSFALPLAPNVPLALVALTLCGLGYAAVFPLVMAIAGELFPAVTGSVAGLLIASSAIFSTIFPWIAGILVQYADARAALVITIPSTMAMLVVSLMFARVRPVSPTEAGHSLSPRT